MRHSIGTSVLAVVLASALVNSFAQVPPDLAEKLKAIGPVINPAATAPMYATRVGAAPSATQTTIERDVAYGKNERHLLDVFRPSAPGDQFKPVLMFVHGGAFVAGNRRTGPESPFYDNVMAWAVQNGMVGVNMTYRLAPKDPWPAGAIDVGQAVRWIYENISQRGGDPKRIFLLGHSAGASHVAAYIAHPQFHQLQGSGLAGAMLLSGVYSITPELVARSPSYPSYFGSDPQKYPQQSSLAGLIASPVPLWVGNAELDPASFREQGELLRSGLAKADKKFASADFAGHNHLSQAYSIHSDDASVGKALLEFINTR